MKTSTEMLTILQTDDKNTLTSPKDGECNSTAFRLNITEKQIVSMVSDSHHFIKFLS